MSETTPPVFVYGATGYTGRLVCEHLASRGLSFSVGGRAEAKVAALAREFPAWRARPVAVTHEAQALAAAFRGAKVVINCTGPFGLLGVPVVEAALDAGCHYLDTTGEQDFMLDVRRRFGERAERAERVVVNGNSWYFALGSSAAELCLAEGGIDSLTLVYAPRGRPTIASLQSLLRTARRPGFFLENGQLVPSRVARRTVELDGGERLVGMTCPAGETVYYLGDPRVRHVDCVMAAELKVAYPMFAGWWQLSKVFGERLDGWGDRLVERYYRNPPPEDVAKTTFIVAALGRGPGARRSCELRGSAPYVVTGWIAAEAAARLLDGKQEHAGVISTAKAFGARHIVTALEAAGVTTRVFSAGAAPRDERGAA